MPSSYQINHESPCGGSQGKNLCNFFSFIWSLEQVLVTFNWIAEIIKVHLLLRGLRVVGGKKAIHILEEGAHATLRS